jgi:hypothetical protein
MKTLLICLAIALALRMAFDQLTASPTPTQGFNKADHPVVTATEIALFRPWDGSVWTHIHRHGDNAWHLVTPGPLGKNLEFARNSQAFQSRNLECL